MPNIRVAVLVDLPREAASGGHVKYWESVAQAAVKENTPVDLTIYFSGTDEDEVLSPNVRYQFLPPVFSTARLKFLPYVPAHTDLAPFHAELANELSNYDVVHTTDGFFAYARTAARTTRWNEIPLVTSFHTDTPAYAELFTRQTLEGFFGHKFGKWVDSMFRISASERIRKEKRLTKHLRSCATAFAMRPEDIELAQAVMGQDNIKPMRLGVDKDMFAPASEARREVESEYNIAAGKFLVLFVGRVDVGKNMPILMQACVDAIDKGAPLHLMVVGLGPMREKVKMTLGANATLAGLLTHEKLARLYAAADCLAIASDIEIGGLIGLEALSSGCPVLVSEQSGVAQLCGAPLAMQTVASTTAAWATALAALAQDAEKQATMREEALAFRRDHLAGWKDVLHADFMPAWQNAARPKVK